MFWFFLSLYVTFLVVGGRGSKKTLFHKRYEISVIGLVLKIKQ